MTPTTASLSKPKSSLTAFKSKKELNEFLRKFAREQRRRADLYSKEDAKSAANESAPMATPSSDSDSESITNNQTAGVDEGGIVKLQMTLDRLMHSHVNAA